MAYSTSNPPKLVLQSIGNSGPAIWQYSSADASATVRVTGYITNGGALGMKVGDLVLMYDTGGGILSTLKVATVSATYPGAVDLADATVVGSATNTD
jgi:hypothetical protein